VTGSFCLLGRYVQAVVDLFGAFEQLRRLDRFGQGDGLGAVLSRLAAAVVA